jgi:hypothetical protein
MRNLTKFRISSHHLHIESGRYIRVHLRSQGYVSSAAQVKLRTKYFVGPRSPTVITPTLITPTIITPTLNTSTVIDSLCNSGTFSNPNAVRDCPFSLKGAWFLSRVLMVN